WPDSSPRAVRPAVRAGQPADGPADGPGAGPLLPGSLAGCAINPAAAASIRGVLGAVCDGARQTGRVLQEVCPCPDLRHRAAGGRVRPSELAPAWRWSRW